MLRFPGVEGCTSQTPTATCCSNRPTMISLTEEWYSDAFSNKSTWAASADISQRHIHSNTTEVVPWRGKKPTTTMACCGSRRRCPQVPETTTTTIMLIEKSVVLIPGDERGILPSLSLSLAISVSKPSVILNRPRSLPIFKPIDHPEQIVCLHNRIGLHRGLVTCTGRSGFARTKNVAREQTKDRGWKKKDKKKMMYCIS